MIAIIPARGGSKGVPKKNIYLIGGKPLIYYTIAEALKSKELDKVVVSTDDEEIARISKNLGAEVPFLRPKELAQDDTSTKEALKNLLPELEKFYKIKIDQYVLLEPTSPLRQVSHIDEAIRVFYSVAEKYDSVLGLSEAKCSPYHMNKITPQNEVVQLLTDFPQETKRQDFPKVYMSNGAIYVVKSANILNKNSILGQKIYPYIMPEEFSFEVDTLIDVKIVECLLREQGRIKPSL